MALTPIIISFLFTLLSNGPRDLGQFENIHGIEFPEKDNIILVTEELAHADIYLKEPVLGKELVLEIQYRPINLKSLSVGVREDSFWLSYNSKQKIYRPAINPHYQQITDDGILTSHITIPLTDKLADKDGSIDLMFFAESDDAVQWELHDLQAKVKYATPTYAHFKNYVKSVLTQEKVL